MSYIGNTIQNQNYVPAIDYFSGNGSTTAFTLSRPVASVAQVQVVVNNVAQNPGSAYTVLNSTITFTSAPSSGSNNIYVYYTSPNNSLATLPQSPVISGDTTTSGGYYAQGAFNSGYTDGVVMDYTTGTGRITVGGSDGVGFYNGGPSNRNQLGYLSTDGYLNVNNTFGFKNRIINGAMVIDQRNAGASVSISTANQYTLDRWMCFETQTNKFTVQQNAGSVTPPSGFVKYLGATSSSSYAITSTDVFGVVQRVEGYNIADLNWGTSSAKTVTLSFQIYSSLTGTFGGSLLNGAGNRSYPFTYVISAANTWTSISVTVPGDTSGTWSTNSDNGLTLVFGIGVGATYSGSAGSWSGSTYYSATGATSVVGTNGATFYITGVQLEKGSTATSFDFRPYGTELALCQRYFEVSGTNAYSSAAGYTGSYFSVTKRVSPTLVQTSGVSISFSGVGTNGVYVTGGTTTGFSYTASAEL